ncbi:membrane protein insertion efficiency factor YidD [Methylibium sp.]|uniref:membrane protein insertion efficiency factor YidD n=1 Tax=Methylibium sp. TaxID=2067992 RepID=UPI003D0C90E5
MRAAPGAAAWLGRLPQRLLIGAVQGYRLFFSAWLGSGCRFTPTCSVYAIEALERHGALSGSYLTTRRLLRCHPGCAGGHDPVPDLPPGWLTGRRAAESSFPSSSSSSEVAVSAPRAPCEISS